MHRQAGGQGSHCAQVCLAAAVKAAVLQPLWPVPAPGPARCFPESVQEQAAGQTSWALQVLSTPPPVHCLDISSSLLISLPRAAFRIDTNAEASRRPHVGGEGDCLISWEVKSPTSKHTHTAHSHITHLVVPSPTTNQLRQSEHSGMNHI